MRARRSVLGRLDRDLEAEHGLSLSQYEVLLQLWQAPRRTLRMSDLAKLSLLSPSGLTRLVDRLAQMGMVERRACEEDARVVYAHLTGPGSQRFRAAARTHMRGIREHFSDRLDDGQKCSLREALERVAGD